MIKFPIINDTDPNSQFRNLLDLIPEGWRNAIPLYKLADKLNIDILSLLRLIKYARLEGNVIAVMDVGAFIPENESDLLLFTSYEEARLRFEIEALNTDIKHLDGEEVTIVPKGVDYEE